MGISDRDYYQDDYRAGFGETGGSIVVKLIIINVVIFLAQYLGLLGQFGANLAEKMAVSSDSLRPWLWWQFVTAGFAHSQRDIWHILGNMLSLFFLGRVVEMKYGSKKFLAFYLTAIVLGNIGFSLRTLLFAAPMVAEQGRPPICLGASGGVVATVVVFALSFPRQIVRLWGVISVPAWTVGAMIVFFDIVGAFNENSPVAHDVHLIGAAYGFLFFKSGWELTSLLPTRLFQMLNFKRRPNVRIFDPEKKYQQLDEQADIVLAKLHREGEKSLTSKERKILEEYSRRMQAKRK